MKKIFNRLYIVSAAIFLAVSCKEEPPPVNFKKPIETFNDTSYVNPNPAMAQLKAVVIEDFTGVRCSNCPKGHEVLKELSDSFPNQVVGMSIHAYRSFQFTSPFTGYADFRDSAGDWVLDIIGGGGGLPWGVVDRISSSNYPSVWREAAKKKMVDPPKVNVYLNNVQYNNATREFSVVMKAELTDSLGDEAYFTVAILEDGIISLQKDESLAADPVKNGFDTTYVHNKLLRKMPFFRERLKLKPTDDLVKGRTVERGFKYTLPAGWNADKCSLVFFVHREVEILNAVKVKLK